MQIELTDKAIDYLEKVSGWKRSHAHAVLKKCAEYCEIRAAQQTLEPVPATCPDCKGSGWSEPIWSEKCRTCKGDGQVQNSPSADVQRQELV